MMPSRNILQWVPLLLLLGCDLPPNNIIDRDTGTEDTDEAEFEDTTPLEWDSEDTESSEQDTAEEETDTGVDTPNEATCLSAIMCIASTPEDTFGCLRGLSPEDAQIASSLAFCLIQSCPDAMSDILQFGSCLLMSCSEDAINCIGFSLF
jgi:hypothetical protein